MVAGETKRHLWQSLWDTEEHKEFMSQRSLVHFFGEDMRDPDEPWKHVEFEPKLLEVLKRPNTFMDEHPYLCSVCEGSGCSKCDGTGITEGARLLAQTRIDEHNSDILTNRINEDKVNVTFDLASFKKAELNLYDNYHKKSIDLMGNAVQRMISFLDDPKNIQYSYGRVGHHGPIDVTVESALFSSSGNYHKETDYLIDVFASKLFNSPFYGDMYTSDDVFDFKQQIPDNEFILLVLKDIDVNRCINAIDAVMSRKQPTAPMVAISTMPLKVHDPLDRYNEYFATYGDKIDKHLL